MSSDLIRVLLIGGEAQTVACLQESLRGVTPAPIRLEHADRIPATTAPDEFDAVMLCLDTSGRLTPDDLNALCADATARVPVLFLLCFGDHFIVGELVRANMQGWSAQGQAAGHAGHALERALRQAIAREQAGEEGQQSAAMYRELFEQVPVGLYCSTPDGRLVEANPALVQMLGFPDRASLMAANVADLYVDPAERVREFELLKRDGIVRGIELELRRRDGAVIWVQDFVQAVHDPAGRVQYARGNLVDITERKRTDERLHYLSSHDVLTDLFNRAYFDEALARSGNGNHNQHNQLPISVAVVDIDWMKRTNDTQGHAAGDELLRRTAAVLRAALGGSGGAPGAARIIARIGGDEFAALLPRREAAAAASVVALLRRALAAHNAAYAGPPLSLSVGVATAEPGESLERVMQRADRRMYEDKQAHSYTPGHHR